MTTKHLTSRHVWCALALSLFNVEIQYTPGKMNPSDDPSRDTHYAPEMQQGIGDLLPTFHNKMRGSFMKTLTSWVKTDSGMDAVMNRTVTTCMITAGHARGEENPLDSCRGAPPGRSQGDGRVYAIEAEFGCSQVMPRMCACVCALSETALDEPTGTIEDAIFLLQQGDTLFTNKKKALDRDQRVGAASPGPWSIDAQDLLRRDGSIYVPDDALMRHELLWVHHDDPLAGHFSADRTAELLHRNI